MKAYIFPGQGAQFTGMGKDIYETNINTKELFDQANDILGFKITDIMFVGSADEQKQTQV
nr:[acyl-carrier-protein] S-malonyltransferase [Chryseolinea sp.]